MGAAPPKPLFHPPPLQVIWHCTTSRSYYAVLVVASYILSYAQLLPSHRYGPGISKASTLLRFLGLRKKILPPLTRFLKGFYQSDLVIGVSSIIPTTQNTVTPSSLTEPIILSQPRELYLIHSFANFSDPQSTYHGKRGRDQSIVKGRLYRTHSLFHPDLVIVPELLIHDRRRQPRDTRCLLHDLLLALLPVFFSNYSAMTERPSTASSSRAFTQSSPSLRPNTSSGPGISVTSSSPTGSRTTPPPEPRRSSVASSASSPRPKAKGLYISQQHYPHL